MRNKTGAILIALQVAVTMAIMVNAISIIQSRSESMARPSGVDEENIFHIASVGYTEDFDEQSVIEQDLDAIRAMPGVIDAIQTNSVPLSGGGWSMGLQTEPGEDQEGVGVAVYFVDEHALDAYGLSLVAGENFTAADVTWRERTSQEWSATTLLTQAMAESLFPDNWRDALGATVYINGNEPMTVKGIVERMQAAWNGWDGVERVMLVPQHTLFGSTRYVIRTEPGERDRLMPEVEKLLADRNRDRIVRNMQTMTETRERSYRGDSSMIKILTFTIVLLLLITSLGIVGLASFSVSRRTKQIGTRRALGASKASIARYFMTENVLISGVGVVLGAALTIALNMFLVDAFDLDRLDVWLVPAAMLVLLVVGQLAVFGPARRASAVPPAVATRTI
ncbi:FtsX-like permease family protein [Marinihelvus fidelis]|uniref:FtsX-like permease family protein n=2 Tax=Marinihelvus fidelis TaxID=2613842 RepID=A0A5N0TCK2_9GAMM|nr:FtsX-like permease family protein [Marinihelvus fidelis]